RHVIERINARFGTVDWQPVVALIGNDHERALACMRDCDVLLVNPLIDGMNLVAKEGGLLNRRNGVIVLSERAGAYAQIYNGVLGVAPEDIWATAEALHHALTMPAEERARLARTLRAVLSHEDADSWLGKQVADLGRATSLRADAKQAESIVQEAERVAARRLADTRIAVPAVRGASSPTGQGKTPMADGGIGTDGDAAQES